MADAQVRMFRAKWSIALWPMTLTVAALVLYLLIFGLPAEQETELPVKESKT